MTNEYTNMLQKTNRVAKKSLGRLATLLFITSTVVQAQTGPGGVGNASGSSGQPKNVLWLDASTLELADGNDVSTWPDMSGNGNSLGTSSSSNNSSPNAAPGGVPTFRSGSFDYLEFNDSEHDRLVRNSFTGFPGSNITTFMIFNTSASDDGEGIVSYAVGNGDQSNEYLWVNSKNFSIYIDGNEKNPGTNFRNGAWRILANRWRNSDGLITLHNGGSQVTISSNTNFKTSINIQSGGTLAIGGEQDAVDDNYAANQDFDGNIAELIVYDAYLSDAQRTIVENYLSQKYTIDITNDCFGNLATYHPAYNQDLRGIGSDGTNKHTNSASSGGLTIRESAGSLDADEYVMFAHSNIDHDDEKTDNRADVTNITNRWARDWYVEVNRGGGASGVDGGDVSVEMVFDFGADPALSFSGSLNNYVLLYRSTATGNFDRVYADSYTVEGSDTVVVTVPASRLNTGYYTLGTGNPLLARTWYVFEDGNWSDPNTWTTDASTAPLWKNASNEIPTAADEVIIRSGRTVAIQPGSGFGQDNQKVNSIKIDGNLNVTTSKGHNFNTINGSGVIRMAGHNPGSGLVDNFPQGNVTGNIGFADTDNGGTVIIDAAANITLRTEHTTFNNLHIELASSTNQAVLAEDIVLNGNLKIINGGLQFGDGTTTGRTLAVKNVEIAASGNITTANVNARHTFTIQGNFTNKGKVYFTNRPNFASETDRLNPNHAYYTTEANNGVVDVVFASDNADQTVYCYNTTYFYRVVIDKGVDNTYKLLLRANDANDFRLLGYANDNINNDLETASQNTNAFALINGTAEVGGNIEIPVLNRNGNYAISSTARLWVNGGEVRKTSATAIVPYGIVQVSAGYLEAIGNSGLTLRHNGLIKVEGGNVLTNQIRTSIQGSGSLGGYNQSGGNVVVDGDLGVGGSNNDYYVFSLTYTGNVFIMSGGSLTVTGANSKGAIFINSNPGNIDVTGGTVTLASSNNNLAKVTSRAPFYNLIVTNSINSTDGNAKISVVNGTSGDGTNARTIDPAPDLAVLNDLTIKTGTTRNAGGNVYGGYLNLCSNGTCTNLVVSRNLTIENSAVLDVFTDDNTDDAGSATVTFRGSEDAIFYVGNVSTYTASLTDYDDPSGDASYSQYRLPLYALIVDKSGGTLQLQANGPVNSLSNNNIISGEKNVRATKSRLLYIRNQFALRGGSTLSQLDPVNPTLGYSMRVYTTNIELDGNLFVYEQAVTPTNAFVEWAAGNGTITINSTPTSTIGNLAMEIKNDQVALTSDLSIGRLAYRHGSINIGTYNLKIDVLDLNLESNNTERLPNINSGGSTEYIFGFNDSNRPQFIITAGNASDGGLSLKVPREANVLGPNDDTESIAADPNFNNLHLEYQNENMLYFPVGVATKYTPAVCYIVADGTYTGDEYITVRPVDAELKTTDMTLTAANDGILDYYWNIDYAGFGTGEEPTVSWLFQYNNADAGNTGNLTEASYVPGKVLNGGAYTRSHDGDNDAVRHGGNSGKQGDILGTDPRNIIIFNGITDASSTNDAIDGVSGKIFHDNRSGRDQDLSINPVATNWANAFPGTGFLLENANYTAGVAARFTGNVEVYYSRRSSTFGTNDDPWSDATTWSTIGHNSNTNAGTFPQEGDIAYIGFDSDGDGNAATHKVNVNADIEVAALIFTEFIDITDNGKPVLEDDGSANINGLSETNAFGGGPVLIVPAQYQVDVGVASGGGRFQVLVGCNPCADDPTASTVKIADLSGDFGNFNDNAISAFYYDLSDENTGQNPNELQDNESVFIPSSYPTEYANILLRADQGGFIVFQENITVKNEFRIRDGGGLLLNDGTNGDITIKGNLVYQEKNNNTERIEFPTSGTRTLTINGNIDMSGTDNDHADYILVRNNTPSDALHTLKVGGVINIGDNGDYINLYNSGANGNKAVLELIGESNASYNETSGDPSLNLYQVKMNKGSNQAYSFTFNDEFTISNPDNTGIQPVEIINGVLVFNNSAINVQLTNASAGNFFLPNTANSKASSGSGGLEIRQGTARIAGANTGIVLDGPLRISGGTLNMDGGTNVNNFIEYSSSGQASLEVSAGTLTVGSQIRRGLNANTGVLQYSQSGGTVVVGKNAAPESSRGVFEVTNSGSSFEHTGGSFTIVRDNNSTTIASLLLKSASANIADGTVITLGNSDTPINQDRFGIQSSISLAELAVASDRIDASLYSLPLQTDILTVETGATFHANGFDVTIYERLDNNGIFSTGGNSTNDQYTRFPVTTTASITGTGVTNFWNFEKSGSGTLTLAKNVTVDNNAFIYAGTLNTQTSAFNIKKNLVHDAIHTSAATGPGIIFNGTQKQNLDRSGPGNSQFGVVKLDNASGLIIRDTEENFRINEKLTLSTGVFDMGGNLLIFPANAFIENGSGGTSVTDFNKNNMIQTNSSIRDFGVRKYYNAVSGGNTTFTYPVGLIAYTPMVVTINDASSGYITARPVQDKPPITEDIENTANAGTGACTDPNISDIDNVLQYYWIVKSDGITGFNGNFTMHYNPNDVRVTSPYSIANYGPARLYNADDTWDKVFFTTDFNEATQRIHYSFNDHSDATIEGIYTAGVTLKIKNNETKLLCGGAIPDRVPQFITNSAGGGAFFSGTTYQGNTAPIAGETPDITIKSGDMLLYDQNSIRARKITIETGGTLVIQNGTNNHNLGFVTGEGTLRIESNGPSASFPSGDYEEFFPDAACSGGGVLEYTGTGSYAILNDLPRVRQLILSGSGTRTLPNNFTVSICEDLDIKNNVSVIIPDTNNKTIVLGDVHKSDASNFSNGGGTLVMQGSSPQAIEGDFTGSNALGKLEIANATGITIVNATAAPGVAANQDVEIEDKLIFTNGRVTTNANNSLRMLQGSTTSGYNQSRYVNGPLQAILSDNDNFIFPIGKGNRYGVLSVNDATHPGQTLTWQAEYFNSNAESDGKVTSMTATSDASILSISQGEYWVVTDDAGTAPPPVVGAKIGLSWDASSDAPGDISTLSAMVWDGTEWDNYGGVNHSGNTNAGTFVSNGYVPFSEKVITMGSTEPTVLPVELLSFKAVAKEQTVQLVWETASEINNDYFEVLRSVDGITFKKIGEVAGAGNSNKQLRYEFTDKLPIAGVSYYQLKQVDYNGMYDFSDKVSVEWISTGEYAAFVEINLYPNPAPRGEAKVRVTGLQPQSAVTVKLLDMFGKVHLQQVVEADVLGQSGHMIQPRMRLSAGVYVVSIQQGSQVHQKTLIIR